MSERRRGLPQLYFRPQIYLPAILDFGPVPPLREPVFPLILSVTSLRKSSLTSLPMVYISRLCAFGSAPCHLLPSLTPYLRSPSTFLLSLTLLRDSAYLYSKFLASLLRLELDDRVEASCLKKKKKNQALKESLKEMQKIAD